MAVVNITINGQKIQAQAGQTVLQAAKAAGIDIPTLCNHPALKPESICRICVVEVERQRVLQPACTFPVVEGMVIQTESEKVAAARKTVLQLLFSQRLHYCMYCSESGNSEDVECELQKLAYRYRVDSWKLAPNTLKRWSVDASRTHFVMDHNRCIMCRRCVRACDEIVANHTLSIRGRGARTMIIADDDVPFGESSCVSCGTCLQVCPTGALIDRRSAFMGHGACMERTKTTCMACSVGCGIKAVTRSNILHRIEGDWDESNGGLLCVDGRFNVVETQPKRVSSPLVRKNGHLVESTWDEALAVVAERLHGAKSVAGLVSARTTNESLASFKRFFSDVIKSKQVALLDGAAPPLDLGATATLRDLATSDCVVIVGGDPLKEHKVLAYLTRRAVDHEASLVVVSDSPTGLDKDARLAVRLSDLSMAAGVVQAAERPVVLYAPGLSDTVYAALKAWPQKARFLPLIKGTNAAGAAKLGIAEKDVHGDLLYVLAGDEVAHGRQLPEAGFTVVQGAYHTEWTERADVVLPAQTWAEKTGHIVNVEGRELPAVPFIEAPKGSPADDVALGMLTIQMGKPKAAKARAAVTG
jgi:NADH dehydrogenase/NADH:ubiquinone oxidoreductase subunit G